MRAVLCGVLTYANIVQYLFCNIVSAHRASQLRMSENGGSEPAI